MDFRTEGAVGMFCPAIPVDGRRRCEVYPPPSIRRYFNVGVLDQTS
jgi:hypothetical protein